MTLIIIIGALALLFFLLKPYFQKYDNVILYTGSLGSGKTFCGVKSAKKLLKKNRFKVFFYNLMPWHKDKKPKPMLYSSIPIRVSKYEWSLPVKAEHFLLTERLIEKSIFFCDEISLLLSQQDFKTVNDKALSDFCTLFRQYTKNGYWVITTQSTQKVNHHIRRSLDSAYRLSEFRHFLGFYKVNVRHIDICEDTININQGHSEDTTSRIYGFMGRRSYDTHAYSIRYETVPFGSQIPFKKFKTKKIPRIPVKEKFPCYIDDGDDD